MASGHWAASSEDLTFVSQVGYAHGSPRQHQPLTRFCPELLFTNLSASIEFWCGSCGFAVARDRPAGSLVIQRRLEILQRGDDVGQIIR